MERCGAFLVFGTSDYGADTGNPASTHHEVQYWLNECKMMDKSRKTILLRMTPWEQRFDNLTARVLFGQNEFTLPWLLGEPMPSDLVGNIVKALEVTEIDREESPAHQISPRTNH